MDHGVSPSYRRSPGIQLDDEGRVLPHSILGSLEDFRSYLEAKGEKELVKRITKNQTDPPSKAAVSSKAVEPGLHSDKSLRQKNALQRWDTHVAECRRQQSFLSNLLHRPAEGLLMNQSDLFRETKMQREFLAGLRPLIHSTHGTGFWSLPQHYGDGISGITATLTQTEQGRQKPLTYAGQPRSIRLETGIRADAVRQSARTRAQSSHVQQQYQELREVLSEMDFKKPDIDGLEVIGTNKPRTLVTECCDPVRQEAEEEKEQTDMKNANFDPLAQYDDVQKDTLVPALRFCGQLASWTGNSTINQGQVGISSTIFFEALTGERASSHLELHNEGNTALFYSWQQLDSLPRLLPQTKSTCFYFNCSSGVILPGDTQRIDFIFKSEKPGIKTELWQLNTHPVLMQGASMQVTLRGLAVFEDQTAHQRLFIETNLERVAVRKLCRSIVYEALLGVQSPQRPSSPPDLYITEEQEFLMKNPRLQYLDQPVEKLKKLWQTVNPRCSWDLSVDTLRQAVLSLPESQMELKLAELNSLFLQLSEPSEVKHHLTVEAIGQQLWRNLLDTMVSEALCIRSLLGLPERDIWSDEKDDSQNSDVERSGSRSRLRDVSRAESRSSTSEQSTGAGINKKDKKKERREAARRSKGGQDSASLSETCPERTPLEQVVDEQVLSMYTRLLYKKVYTLMEDLVDSLCDVMDDLNGGDEQDTLIDA